MVLLGYGDELLLVWLLSQGGPHEHVRLQRMEYARSLPADKLRHGRELAVDANIVCLALLVEAGVYLHLPLSVEEWQLKGIVAKGVGLGLAREALA